MVSFTQIPNVIWRKAISLGLINIKAVIQRICVTLTILLGIFTFKSATAQQYQYVLDTLKNKGKLFLPDVGLPGTRNLLIGDDVFFTDIDVPNIVGLYGVQNAQTSGFKLGINGPTVYGLNNRFFVGSGLLGLGGNDGASLSASAGNLTVENGRLVIRDFGDAGSKNLLIGDDAFLTDLDRANILGLFGNTDATKGGLRLGSGGPDLWGKDGRLGIGFSNPSETLHVEGSFYSRDNIKTYGGQFQGIGNFIIRADNDDTGDDDVIFLGSNNAEKMRVKNGNLGIGTANPEKRLHVKANEPNGYVALFENESAGSDADGIAIKINRAQNIVGEQNRFVSFLRDNNSLAGRIEGYQYDQSEVMNMISEVLNVIGVQPTSTAGANDIMLRSLAENIYKSRSGTLQSLFNSNYINYAPPQLAGGQLPSAPSFSLLTKVVSGVLNPGSFPTFDLRSFDSANGRIASDLKPVITPYSNLLEFLAERIVASSQEDLKTSLSDNSRVLNSFLNKNPAVLDLITAGDPWGVAVAAMTIELLAWAEDDGVSYASKGADYAEWLPKTDVNEKFIFGQIVGVKDGKISKQTEGADQVMVISKNPIVLGNMIDESQEANYEKVGFMGQVPVQVIGNVNTGDYILASGLGNGFGIAKSQKDLTLADFKQIVGRAWSENDKPLGVVNVAIGLKTNEWVQILESYDERLMTLEEKLESSFKEQSALSTALNLLDSKISEFMNMAQKANREE
jgi:hypothetical protein